MKTDLERTIRFVALLTENRRIRVERVQEELGLSRSATYRRLRPIRLEDGVVVQKKP